MSIEKLSPLQKTIQTTYLDDGALAGNEKSAILSTVLAGGESAAGLLGWVKSDVLGAKNISAKEAVFYADLQEFLEAVDTTSTFKNGIGANNPLQLYPTLDVKDPKKCIDALKALPRDGRPLVGSPAYQAMMDIILPASVKCHAGTMEFIPDVKVVQDKIVELTKNEDQGVFHQWLSFGGEPGLQVAEALAEASNNGAEAILMIDALYYGGLNEEGPNGQTVGEFLQSSGVETVSYKN